MRWSAGRGAQPPRASQVEGADLIVEHADVRRMLLTQKALIECCRLLAYYAVLQMDRGERSPDKAMRQEAEEELALLTPIVKSMLTDIGIEATGLAVQVHGGPWLHSRDRRRAVAA